MSEWVSPRSAAYHGNVAVALIVAIVTVHLRCTQEQTDGSGTGSPFDQQLQHLVGVLILQLVSAIALPLVSTLARLKFLPFYSQVGCFSLSVPQRFVCVAESPCCNSNVASSRTRTFLRASIKKLRRFRRSIPTSSPSSGCFRSVLRSFCPSNAIAMLLNPATRLLDEAPANNLRVVANSIALHNKLAQ